MPACQRGISCAGYNKYNSRYLRFELFLIPGAPCPSRYTIPPPVSLQSQHIFMLAHQLSSGRENNFAFPPIQLHHDSAGTTPPEIIRVSSHQIQVSSWCWCADSWARYNSRVLPNPTYLHAGAPALLQGKQSASRLSLEEGEQLSEERATKRNDLAAMR
jgi:hypothetical protein